MSAASGEPAAKRRRGEEAPPWHVSLLGVPKHAFQVHGIAGLPPDAQARATAAAVAPIVWSRDELARHATCGAAYFTQLVLHGLVRVSVAPGSTLGRPSITGAGLGPTTRLLRIIGVDYGTAGSVPSSAPAVAAYDVAYAIPPQGAGQAPQSCVLRGTSIRLVVLDYWGGGVARVPLASVSSKPPAPEEVGAFLAAAARFHSWGLFNPAAPPPIALEPADLAWSNGVLRRAQAATVSEVAATELVARAVCRIVAKFPPIPSSSASGGGIGSIAAARAALLQEQAVGLACAVVAVSRPLTLAGAGAASASASSPAPASSSPQMWGGASSATASSTAGHHQARHGVYVVLRSWLAQDVLEGHHTHCLRLDAVDGSPVAAGGARRRSLLEHQFDRLLEVLRLRRTGTAGAGTAVPLLSGADALATHGGSTAVAGRKRPRSELSGAESTAAVGSVAVAPTAATTVGAASSADGVLGLDSAVAQSTSDVFLPCLAGDKEGDDDAASDASSGAGSHGDDWDAPHFDGDGAGAATSRRRRFRYGTRGVDASGMGPGGGRRRERTVGQYRYLSLLQGAVGAGGAALQIPQRHADDEAAHLCTRCAHISDGATASARAVGDAFQPDVTAWKLVVATLCSACTHCGSKMNDGEDDHGDAASEGTASGSHQPWWSLQAFRSCILQQVDVPVEIEHDGVATSTAAAVTPPAVLPAHAGAAASFAVAVPAASAAAAGGRVVTPAQLPAASVSSSGADAPARGGKRHVVYDVHPEAPGTVQSCRLLSSPHQLFVVDVDRLAQMAIAQRVQSSTIFPAAGAASSTGDAHPAAASAAAPSRALTPPEATHPASCMLWAPTWRRAAVQWLTDALIPAQQRAVSTDAPAPLPIWLNEWELTAASGVCAYSTATAGAGAKGNASGGSSADDAALPMYFRPASMLLQAPHLLEGASLPTDIDVGLDDGGKRTSMTFLARAFAASSAAGAAGLALTSPFSLSLLPPVSDPVAARLLAALSGHAAAISAACCAHSAPQTLHQRMVGPQATSAARASLSLDHETSGPAAGSGIASSSAGAASAPLATAAPRRVPPAGAPGEGYTVMIPTIDDVQGRLAAVAPDAVELCEMLSTAHGHPLSERARHEAETARAAKFPKPLVGVAAGGDAAAAAAAATAAARGGAPAVAGHAALASVDVQGPVMVSSTSVTRLGTPTPSWATAKGLAIQLTALAQRRALALGHARVPWQTVTLDTPASPLPVPVTPSYWQRLRTQLLQSTTPHVDGAAAAPGFPSLASLPAGLPSLLLDAPSAATGAVGYSADILSPLWSPALFPHRSGAFTTLLYHGTSAHMARNLVAEDAFRRPLCRQLDICRATAGLGCQCQMEGLGVYVGDAEKAAGFGDKRGAADQARGGAIVGGRMSVFIDLGAVKVALPVPPCPCGCGKGYVDHPGCFYVGEGFDTLYVRDDSLPAARYKEWATADPSRCAVAGTHEVLRAVR